MANKKQLSILKQGVEVWNKWREENRDILIDLTETDLRYINLGADTSWHLPNKPVYTRGLDLSYANLRGTNLTGANLLKADLHEADLSNAGFGEANLMSAILYKANLGGSWLELADLSGANLGFANLSKTELIGVNFYSAKLIGSNFEETKMGSTIFGNTDMSETVGLENVKHYAPSTIGTDTLVKSKGKISEVFLRGCGLSDWEVEQVKLYNPDLNNDERNRILYKIYDLQASQALQISPLFISYSHADNAFVDKIGDYLNRQGVRYWRDIHNTVAGPLEAQVDRAIRQNPTVLIVFSENSISSDWVQHEVRKAREFTKELGRHVLCPITLDNSWKNSPWPERLMEQVQEYNILDFSKWQDDKIFEKQFRKLIEGLNLFYKA